MGVDRTGRQLVWPPVPVAPGWPRATRLPPGGGKRQSRRARGGGWGAMGVGHRGGWQSCRSAGRSRSHVCGTTRYASLRPILGGFKATRLCCRVAFGLPGYPGNSRGGWSADKTEPAVLFEGCWLLVVVGCGGGPARQRIRASSGVNRRALRGDVHAKGPWGCSAPQHSAQPSGRVRCCRLNRRTRTDTAPEPRVWRALVPVKGRRWRRRVVEAAAFAVREAKGGRQAGVVPRERWWEGERGHFSVFHHSGGCKKDEGAVKARGPCWLAVQPA